jgi:hypothetical protein
MKPTILLLLGMLVCAAAYITVMTFADNVARGLATLSGK